jgi:hypothetical protein
VVTVTTSADLDASKTTWEITIGFQKVTLAKLADRQAAFLVPILPSGATALDLTAIGAKNPPAFTVGTYSPIQNPDAVIATFTNSLATSIAHLELLAKDPAYALPQQNLALVKNLQQSILRELPAASTSEKLEIAYVVQKAILKPVDYGTLQGVKIADLQLIKNSPLPGSMQTTQSVVDQAKKLGQLAAAHIAAVGAVVVGVALFATVKIHKSKIMALIGAAIAAIGLNEALELDDQLFNLIGIPSNFVSYQSNGPTPTVVTFNGSTTSSLIATATLRTIQASDAGGAALLRSAISASQQLASTYTQLRNMLQEIKGLLTGTATELAPYVSQVKTTAIKSTQSMLGSVLKVANISNPAINITATGDGETLKLQATSPSITTKTPFTFDVVYENSALDVSIKKTVQAEYSNVDSTEIYKAAVVGAWTAQNFDPNNGPGEVYKLEMSADGKIVYTVATGAKYGANWRIVKTDLGYQLFDSGFWHPGYYSLKRDRLKLPLRGFKTYNTFLTGNGYTAVQYIKL